jgi:hypothetical protein
MTAPTDAAPAPAPEESPARRKSPLVYVGQAGGVVALVASVVGLLFVFKPGWQPTPPPDIGTLKIADSSVRQPVTFGRYLERVRLPAMDFTKAFRQRRGLLIEFDYVAEGFRGKRLPIQWELVDAKTNERVGTVDDDNGGNDAVGIKPSTNQETAKWFVWVPAPKAGRNYYVTVTIYRPREGDVDVPLADFDTAEFAGSTA